MRIDLDTPIQLAPQGDAQRHAKLVDAAQQFEASMLQELLKPMQHGQDSWGGEEQSDDSSTDTLGSFGSEAMAKAIAKAGGFGIARQIVAKVALEGQKNSENKSVGANALSLHGR
jgi:peptidoglycan hydrolase FlgJ